MDPRVKIELSWFPIFCSVWQENRQEGRTSREQTIHVAGINGFENAATLSFVFACLLAYVLVVFLQAPTC